MGTHVRSLKLKVETFIEQMIQLQPKNPTFGERATSNDYNFTICPTHIFVNFLSFLTNFPALACDVASCPRKTDDGFYLGQSH